MRADVGKGSPNPRLLSPGKNRAWLRLAAATAALLTTAGVAALAGAGPASAATSLKSLAEAKGRYFGTAMTQSMLSSSTVTRPSRRSSSTWSPRATR